MKENDIKSSVIRYLKSSNACGTVVWFSRLNSGKVQTQYGSWMQLCESGTPDFVVLTKHNVVVFLETKSPKESSIKFEQNEFFKRMKRFDFVRCFAVSDYGDGLVGCNINLENKKIIKGSAKKIGDILNEKM